MALDLIDKQDNFEIIRDQIANILVNEVANQKALALAAGKDSSLWDLRIFLERSNPWEQYLHDDTDKTPIVNVWFDNENFDAKSSTLVERQKTNGTFNIDCYGFGISSDDGGAGHNPGDKDAAINVHRAIRLVRNIIMSAENMYLQLPRGTAWDRVPQSINIFQPSIDARYVQNIVGARLALNVSYNEFGLQISGEIMDTLSIDINRAEDGQLIAEADYTYPLP